MEEQKIKSKRQKFSFFLVGIVFLFIFLAFVVNANPQGLDNLNITSNETGATIDNGNIVNISGGYIATLNLSTTTQDPHWKAFVGWVNGAFTLDDSSGSTIYDWSLTTVNGEVYATRDSGSIGWSQIDCANVTQMENENTALHHNNTEDNITATFDDTTHKTFVVAGNTIPANSCPTLNTYRDNSTQDDSFEEMVLDDDTNIVYATILENNADGFDENNYDFQMIVPEDGSDTFKGATAYYLYVEVS